MKGSDQDAVAFRVAQRDRPPPVRFVGSRLDLAFLSQRGGEHSLQLVVAAVEARTGDGVVDPVSQFV
jgi:hypothetical protein